MSASPDEICAYLRAHPTATAQDLSRALACTPANVRYHLSRLVESGQVQVASKRAAAGKGRPVLEYALTPLAQEHNLGGLAGALLAEMLAQPDTAEAERRLAHAAGRLAGSPPAHGQHLTRRLGAVIRRLNQLAYHARWEAHAGGPRIYLTHCPFAALLPEHAPALCRFDACLLSSLLGAPVKQLTPLSSHPCVFSITL